MKNNPSISVYIPTKNRGDCLQKALYSVAKQTLSPIEIIIADDGSTDHTEDIIQAFRHSTSIPVLVLKSPISRGACSARNQAIWSASGEFITGLDDDDEFTAERLENLLNNYSDSYSLVASSVVYKYGKLKKKYQGHTGIITLDDLLHYNKIGNQFFAKTERVKNIGGFDERLPSFQDYDLLVRLVDHYGSALKIPSGDYIVNCNLEDRISRKNEIVRAGFDMFFEKHTKKMNDQHKKSMRFLKKKIANQALSLCELFELINMGNYRSVLYYWLQSIRDVFK